MAHTNSTSNYELSQFIGTDKPTFLGDYNGDMLKIDAAIKGAADDASGAVTTANAASALASDAASTATSAASDASTASATATTALNTANNATTTAQSASTTATSAATDAATAVSTANAAMSAATGAATASGTSYDNTVSGLVANTVQGAIDEMVSATIQHGIFEIWANPNPTADYTAGTFTVNVDITNFDALFFEIAPKKDETWGAQLYTYDTSYLSSTQSSLGAHTLSLTASTGKISLYYRSLYLSYDNGVLSVQVNDCSTMLLDSYGTATTNTTSNDKEIPMRILGLMHNA